jgi:hypothetical protein
MRKVPGVAFVARWYCPVARTTVGLLPDFYASRMPGTLDALEETVARVEEAATIERAAAEIRPADVPDAVTLPSALRWVQLRMHLVRVALIAALGLFPDRFAPGTPSITHFRERLGTTRVLVALREIAEAHLHALPRPLGLVPRPQHVWMRSRAHQQSPGSDGDLPPA